jgi:predicted amino acid-binding ACT domain protein
VVVKTELVQVQDKHGIVKALSQVVEMEQVTILVEHQEVDSQVVEMAVRVEMDQLIQVQVEVDQNEATQVVGQEHQVAQVAQVALSLDLNIKTRSIYGTLCRIRWKQRSIESYGD